MRKFQENLDNSFILQLITCANKYKKNSFFDLTYNAIIVLLHDVNYS